MTVYQYEAMDCTGEVIKDLIDAEDEKEAQAFIRRLGLFVTKIAEKKPVVVDSEPNHSHLFRFKVGLTEGSVKLDVGIFWILGGIVLVSGLLLFLSR